MAPHPEIGRELRISELQPPAIVVLEREGSATATVWVKEVMPDSVIFWIGAARMYFLAIRTGPDLERITDDPGRILHVREYLGEP